MSLIDITRWQWMLIGLVLGLIVGYVRHQYTDAEPSGYGSMNQPEFEHAIGWMRDVKASGGQPPILGKMTVFRVHDPNHPDQTSYAVTLMYWNTTGRETAQDDDGRFDTKYRAKIFKAPMPYLVGRKTPVRPADADPGWLVRTAEKLHIKDPDPPGTVLDYLRSIEKSHGVSYSYQWWRERRASLVMWMAGCAVVIGFIWPTVINLATFGTFTRPREEPGTDLSKVGTGPPSQQHASVVSAADMAQVADMATRLEQDLARGAPPSATSSVTPPSAPEPPKFQSAPPPETDAERQAREAREFGRDPDDFYPTERHHAPHKPGE
ncbi:MAG: hypothetical protein ABSH20_24060 [Tepidisphaeraceae bacterium]|jgi:hypothetical protein